jgi:hypothetical protein
MAQRECSDGVADDCVLFAHHPSPLAAVNLRVACFKAIFVDEVWHWTVKLLTSAFHHLLHFVDGVLVELSVLG